MDEPTSVLTPQEVEILFETLRKLSAEGTAILYISHKLEEIRALCDARHDPAAGQGGRRPATRARRRARELAETDGRHDAARARTRGDRDAGRGGAEASNALSAASPTPFGTPLQVDLASRCARARSWASAASPATGRTNCWRRCRARLRTSRGAIELDGRADRRSWARTRGAALALLAAPEERLGHAAAPDMSLTENALLTGGRAAEAVASAASSTGPKARAFAEEVIAAFDVRTPGPDDAARALSGGNLQKFVIGREILQDPTVLVVNQPTWGVDASAAAAIRQALLDLARAGCGGDRHQSGPRRADGDLRPLRRAERGAAVGAASDARA